jgi:glycosyltransferase involved in cell wall biosynthesis
MKIFFIGQKGIPTVTGGVERHVEELAVRLAELGHEIYAYTRHNYSDRKLKVYKGVNLISLPSIPTKHLDAISHTFLAILDVSRRRDIDVIHFQSIGPSFLIWLAKLLNPRTPIISTFHSQCYQHHKWGRIARTALKFGEYVCCKFSDKTIAVSKNLRDYGVRAYQREIIFVPNGVDIPEITAAQDISAWGLAKDNYIVTVSRLVRHKGIHYLIEAFKQSVTDKKLVIVGDGSFTDDYVQELKNLAADDPRIIFTGNQTGQRLNELFSNAYLFVQPSESEGLSIALLEAMAYGLPVLVSDIPENIEAINNCGFTFQNKNIGDLKIKLDFMLANPSLAHEQAMLGRENVTMNFNWDMIASKTVKVYNEAAYQKIISRCKSKKIYCKV